MSDIKQKATKLRLKIEELKRCGLDKLAEVTLIEDEIIKTIDLAIVEDRIERESWR